MAGNRHRCFIIASLMSLACMLQAGATSHAEADLAGGIAAISAEEPMPLYLAVFINGQDRKLVANFLLHPDGRMSAPGTELEELGIALPEGSGSDVFLEDLAGLSYVYDEERQVIDFTAKDEALQPQLVSGAGKSDLLAAQPGYGAVLNYGLYATTPDELLDGNFDLSGLSLALDGRVYTPVGVLSSTGVARSNGLTVEGSSVVRTETSFIHTDQENMVEYVVGDTISSSLPWSRSIRMGGLQVRRDFQLRSDIVTTPLLTASGSAALPSTVDVYVDNVRTFSGSVEQGPFLLSDIPVIDRQGDARIVLRDVSGRETEVSIPFYASQYLLKPGMLDYSVEAGFARREFGQESFSYAADPVASASLRYGLTDDITLEAHAEGRSDLLMGGVGFTTVLFDRAEVSGAAGGSIFGEDTGFFAYGRLSTELAGFDLNVSSFRSFGDFADLAYVTGLDEFGDTTLMEDYAYLEPPKAMDVVSLGVPVFFDDTSFNLSLAHVVRESETDLVLSASYSRDLGWRDASIRFSGFMDFDDDGGLGLVAGISMPLGGQRFFNASLARDPDGNLTPAASVQKSLGSEVGSFGYRVDGSGTDIEGDGGAGASYRSSFGVAEARLRANDGRVAASASFDGALVAAGGGVFASQTVNDSFAVVDAGFPDVPVMLQNRPVAKTGRNGKALVTGLRSYSRNKVAIDVAGLPADASVSASEETVIPARRSGVAVDFQGAVQAAALIVLRDAVGGFVEPGATVTLNGRSTEDYVGYDGQLWLEGLEDSNTISVTSGKGTCTASFDYAPDPGNQVIIDPVVCQ